MTLMNWFKGLLAAIIGGAANAVTVMIVDPTNFNLTTGLAKLGTVSLVSAIVGAALYLKQSPLPQDPQVRINALKTPVVLLLVAATLSLPLMGMSCSKNIGFNSAQQIATMTPSDKVLLFKSSYNKAYNDYKVQLVMTPVDKMSEKQKQTLRDTKAALTKVYPLIESYDDAVKMKVTPDGSWEPLIMALLNQLGANIK